MQLTPTNLSLRKNMKDMKQVDSDASDCEAAVENPIESLRCFFPQHKQRIRARPHRPTEDEMDDYNMAVTSAIRSKDLTKLRDLLDEGESFDACNSNGEYLIHLACRRGDVATVKFLVQEAHVNVNVRDSMGRSILHDACWKSKPDTELMSVLVRVISPDLLLAEDNRGHSPFDYARRTHWGVWNQFLVDHEDLIRLRVSLVEAVDCIV